MIVFQNFYGDRDKSLLFRAIIIVGVALFVMSDKGGNESITTNEIVDKTEETGENLTNEEAPTSLETIPSETPLVRNGTQTASKDKTKSNRRVII